MYAVIRHDHIEAEFQYLVIAGTFFQLIRGPVVCTITLSEAGAGGFCCCNVTSKYVFDRSPGGPLSLPGHCSVSDLQFSYIIDLWHGNIPHCLFEKFYRWVRIGVALYLKIISCISVLRKRSLDLHGPQSNPPWGSMCDCDRPEAALKSKCFFFMM